VYEGDATVAEVRATATGAVLARVVPPRPYVHFSGVTAAADDRTFVLVAEEKSNPPELNQEQRGYPRAYYQPSRFYLLRFDPAGGRVTLRGLPAALIPAGNEVHDLALSPDGTSLAADIGSSIPGIGHLYLFNLATGTERSWSFRPCRGCNPSSGGLGFGGVSPDALSWTADGKHLAFVGPDRLTFPARSTVRLLDVTRPGTDLLANSKPVAELPPGDDLKELTWRGAVVTPDGRTVVIVEELASLGAPLRLRDRLLECSTATGRVTAILDDRNDLAGYLYQQVMYTNATGSVLIVSGVRKGMTAGILRGGTYTPIPWGPRIATAVW